MNAKFIFFFKITEIKVREKQTHANFSIITQILNNSKAELTVCCAKLHSKASSFAPTLTTVTRHKTSNGMATSEENTDGRHMT